MESVQYTVFLGFSVTFSSTLFGETKPDDLEVCMRAANLRSLANDGTSHAMLIAITATPVDKMKMLIGFVCRER